MRAGQSETACTAVVQFDAARNLDGFLAVDEQAFLALERQLPPDATRVAGAAWFSIS